MKGQRLSWHSHFRLISQDTGALASSFKTLSFSFRSSASIAAVSASRPGAPCLPCGPRGPRGPDRIPGVSGAGGSAAPLPRPPTGGHTAGRHVTPLSCDTDDNHFDVPDAFRAMLSRFPGSAPLITPSNRPARLNAAPPLCPGTTHERPTPPKIA